MIIKGLFFPAFISMAVYRWLVRKGSYHWQETVIRYGIYVLATTWCTQLTITYLLGVSQVSEEALLSFPFFTKYVLIAVVWAVVLSLAGELIKKYINISIKFSAGRENRQDEKE